MRTRRVWALLLAAVLLTGAPQAAPEDATPSLPTPEEVLDSLKRTLAWYQEARLAIQTAREAGIGLAVREDEPTILRMLQRAFEMARAKAALIEHIQTTERTGETPAARRAARRAQLEAAVQEGERELARLRDSVRNVSAARRQKLEREITAAENRLALDRLRLELLSGLEKADASLVSGEADLTHQIQALQESVPELIASSTSAKPPTVIAAAQQPSPPSGRGTWPLANRLLTLQRARSAFTHLAGTTHQLTAEIDGDVDTTRATIRELSRRLTTLAANPGGEAAAPLAGAADDEFRRGLERLKLFGGVLVPLRAESALLHRVESDVRAWQRAIDRELWRGVQELALGFVGVVIAMGAVALGAAVWRVAVNRYVRDAYRRRLLLRARAIVSGVAVVLVLVFHFTSELTALVTALGFAAAGIAFALQTVILSIAGYVSMMAPNGIRVGDRVSLQGPFGYVHGEVLEIGLVRLRLRELTTDGLEPTGRTVVFPNSVVFTGSFFKHPSGQSRAA